LVSRIHPIGQSLLELPVGVDIDGTRFGGDGTGGVFSQIEPSDGERLVASPVADTNLSRVLFIDFRTGGDQFQMARPSHGEVIHTVDITANTTTVKSGAKTTVIAGVPANHVGATAAPATMLYVDGNITALSGPSSGAAIQDGYGATVAAASNITITGNILYKTEPVTMTQNQIPNTPADTLIPGNNNGQVLGIFTANGNVNLDVPSSGQNLEIDASIATIAKNGSGGIVNTGNAINTLNIVGGRIQNTIQNINSTSRNVFFDRRFTQGNFAPPWFPSTTVTGAASDSVTSVVPSVQRTQWVSPIS
jgi:hypothetical protein